MYQLDGNDTIDDENDSYQEAYWANGVMGTNFQTYIDIDISKSNLTEQEKKVEKLNAQMKRLKSWGKRGMELKDCNL